MEIIKDNFEQRYHAAYLSKSEAIHQDLFAKYVKTELSKRQVRKIAFKKSYNNLIVHFNSFYIDNIDNVEFILLQLKRYQNMSKKEKFSIIKNANEIFISNVLIIVNFYDKDYQFPSKESLIKIISNEIISDYQKYVRNRNTFIVIIFIFIASAITFYILSKIKNYSIPYILYAIQMWYLFYFYNKKLK